MGTTRGGGLCLGRHHLHAYESPLSASPLILISISGDCAMGANLTLYISKPVNILSTHSEPVSSISSGREVYSSLLARVQIHLRHTFTGDRARSILSIQPGVCQQASSYQVVNKSIAR